ncbi:hypothetical protein [Amycolatopsis sp. CA-230715]|uniref:hypothetical protein n=1 Tax=Amycolatopsis sp. CA-230715 TaxID=2745196 RepID=UPI001C02418E|nr:hypothetical protein [Amycolatopsis sp. CA-230715]QWF81885.1 hypothetical protein HUW46_05319 [Amycolatopsis sp. CA-230715]
MKTARALLVLPGLAALAWGVVLFVQFAFPLGPQGVVALGWLAGGTLVHDVVVGPLVGIIGFALSRILPGPWRAPVLTGAVTSAVLGLIAFPLLWREYGAPPLPGLHDGDTLGGLLISLGVVWLAVMVAGLVRTLKNHP